MNTILTDTTHSNLFDFAQFLAQQAGADQLKREFDKAYCLERYRVKLAAMNREQWPRVSECPKVSDD